MAFLLIPLLVSVLVSPTTAFSPSNNPVQHRSTSSSPSQLHDLIKGEAIDSVPLNENLGGVGLAKRSAIKITGTAKKGGKADADILKDLYRYEKMRALSEAEVKSAMEKYGCKLVCSGFGKELYYFPEDSARVDDRVIKLCPEEAAKDALASASSIGDAKHIIMNFLGGDDLIYGEVKNACDMLVEQLDIPDKAKIKFNSMCFQEFEAGTCSVTVVAHDGQSAGTEGVDESIAKGEVYQYNGKWYTSVKEDITTATD
jgi:hypothetical protein